MMKLKIIFKKNGCPNNFFDICIKKILVRRFIGKGICICIKKGINIFTTVYRQELPQIMMKLVNFVKNNSPFR